MIISRALKDWDFYLNLLLYNNKKEKAITNLCHVKVWEITYP